MEVVVGTGGATREMLMMMTMMMNELLAGCMWIVVDRRVRFDDFPEDAHWSRRWPAA